MRHRTLIAGALGVALIASVYVITRRAPISRLSDLAEPIDAAVVQGSSDITKSEPLSDSSSTGRERVAIEVRAMSPTFRNSTFLIAIRRAGYYCDDIVSASESAEGGWVASCANKGGYTLSVRAIDEFDVRPIGHYLDGIAPVLIPRDLEQR